MTDFTQQKDYTEDIKTLRTDQYKENIDDDKIIEMYKEDLNDADSLYNELLSVFHKSERYWRGQQVTIGDLRYGESNIVDNKILVAVEKSVAKITSSTPHPWITVTPKNSKGLAIQEKLQRMMIDAWDYDLNMQQKGERTSRIYYMARVGWAKYGLDDSSDLFVDVVRPESIRYEINKELHESRFFIHYLTASIAELKARFPNSKEHLNDLAKQHGSNRSEITYAEYWGKFYTDSGECKIFVSWLYNGHVFKTDVDPLWHKTKKNNHFKYNRFPFIPMHSLATAGSVVDETSLIEQSLALQDNINERKRQISRNAWLANGILVATAAAMDEADFLSMDFFTDKVFLKAEMESISAGFGTVTGRPFESGIYDDMQQSASSISDIFGIVDIIPGEISQPEGTGRLDLTARAYEQFAEDIYNAVLQLMCVSSKDEYIISTDKDEYGDTVMPGANTGLTTIDTNDNKIAKKDLYNFDVKIRVRKGTVLPKDPVTDRDAAFKLMQTGQLDPYTFAKMAGLDNPKQFAKRMFMWSDPELKKDLFPDLAGGENLHPTGIRQIEIINKAFDNEGFMKKYADSLEDLPAATVYADFMDAEDLNSHVNTHNLYMRGAEVHPDLIPFSDLPIDLQTIHMKHVKFEKDQLEMLLKEEQQNQPPQAEQMPPEGQMPAEMSIDGQLPPEAALPIDQPLPPEQALPIEVQPPVV